MNLDEVWRIREEEVYPKLFGKVSRGIFSLTQDLFARCFGTVELDPLWLFFGVFEFAPTADRSSWLYVTSGCSNPYDDPYTSNESESGAGVEFTLQVSEQSDWAIDRLQTMLALDLLLRAGHFPNRGPLPLGGHISLRAPVNGVESCQIRNLILVSWEGRPGGFQLPSGSVALAGFTGVTDAELAFAKANGSHALVEKLRDAGFHPTTNPRRRSIF